MDKQFKLWVREYFDVRKYTKRERPDTHPDFVELVKLLRIVYNEGVIDGAPLYSVASGITVP